MISYDTLMKNCFKDWSQSRCRAATLLTQMIPCGLNSVYADRTDIYMQAYQSHIEIWRCADITINMLILDELCVRIHISSLLITAIPIFLDRNLGGV